MAQLETYLQDIQSVGQIKLDQKVKKSIQKIIQENTTFSLQNFTKENLSNIKKSAYDYINTVSEISVKMRILSVLYNQRKNLRKKIENEQLALSQQYADNTERINAIHLTESKLREAELATLRFTAQLQLFLKQEIDIIYIYQSKNGKVIRPYRITNYQDILKIQKGHGGQLQSRLRASKKILDNNAEYIGKEKYSIGLDQANKLDNVWEEVIKRYNNYVYNRKDHLVLWNMMARPKWHGMWLYERGDLAEAYANFVFARKNSYFVGNVNRPPETDIEVFMNALTQVDATFGGLEGDIEYRDKDGHLISAAIKSLKASPQSMIQTIKLAKQLLETSLDEEKFLRQYKKKEEKESQHIIEQFTGQEIRDTFNSAILRKHS